MTTQQPCTSPDHEYEIEEYGSCDTCGQWAGETSPRQAVNNRDDDRDLPDNDDETQRRVAFFERNDPDGYDRNGAFDGFQVTSDADNGL
jgi:hypothetical protein